MDWVILGSCFTTIRNEVLLYWWDHDGVVIVSQDLLPVCSQPTLRCASAVRCSKDGSVTRWEHVYRWRRARLRYLQWVGNRDTVFYYPIYLVMYVSKHKHNEMENTHGSISYHSYRWNIVRACMPPINMLFPHTRRKERALICEAYPGDLSSSMNSPFYALAMCTD